MADKSGRVSKQCRRIRPQFVRQLGVDEGEEVRCDGAMDTCVEEEVTTTRTVIPKEDGLELSQDPFTRMTSTPDAGVCTDAEGRPFYPNFDENSQAFSPIPMIATIAHDMPTPPERSTSPIPGK